MVQKDKSDPFIAVSMDVLRGGLRDIPFDLFIEVSGENYAHLFSKETGIDYERLHQYRQKGVTHLYIRASEEGAFLKYLANGPQKIFENPTATPADQLVALINMTEQNLAELFSRFPTDAQTTKTTRTIIHNYLKILSDNPDQLKILVRLASLGNYHYYHAVATSVFSIFLAKNLKQYSPAMLETLGLGGFLHDVGMIEVPKEILEAPRKLTASEFENIKKHSHRGLELLSSAKNIPDEVCYIIYQHHEQPNGKGYPNGLKNGSIFYPAKIVAIADAFTALISRRPFRQELDVPEALQLMESENGKFDPELLKVLRKMVLENKLKKAA